MTNQTQLRRTLEAEWHNAVETLKREYAAEMRKTDPHQAEEVKHLNERFQLRITRAATDYLSTLKDQVGHQPNVNAYEAALAEVEEPSGINKAIKWIIRTLFPPALGIGTAWICLALVSQAFETSVQVHESTLSRIITDIIIGQRTWADKVIYFIADYTGMTFNVSAQIACPGLPLLIGAFVWLIAWWRVRRKGFKKDKNECRQSLLDFFDTAVMPRMKEWGEDALDAALSGAGQPKMA